MVATPDREALAALAAALAPDLAPVVAAASEVPAEAFSAMAARPVPTPAVAVARRPRTSADAVLARPGRVVLLDRPNHLGNLGAVIRVAAAAGAAGVLSTGDRDPWDPAALRGSAGLHYAIGVAAVPALPSTGRLLAAFDPAGEPLGSAPLPPDAVLAFGSERHGLSAGVREAADLVVAIPMRPGVSSLNLATSVAVALYAG
ncbi:MAG: TrmH family RNA methyltransferase [Actinobacteria bacterium]|nr:TrmH family RNA methyltransferase [Actinomycetota bacterium]